MVLIVSFSRDFIIRGTPRLNNDIFDAELCLNSDNIFKSDGSSSTNFHKRVGYLLLLMNLQIINYFMHTFKVERIFLDVIIDSF